MAKRSRKLKIGDEVQFNIGRGKFIGEIAFIFIDGYASIRFPGSDGWIIRSLDKATKI